MGKIRLLPPEIVSKIAAGEVVERPASVVKELLENALDAKAMNVEVELSGGGRKLIRVTDDGEGMAPEDARRALERHTTSKIETEKDLWEIRSYGFRGEALFSIAAVSRLRLLTKPEGSLAGVEIRAEAGIIESSIAAGCPKGTSIEVQDLFFNVPARLKFLKSPGTELSHISEILGRMALANPEIRFRLLHEGRLLANYPVREDFLPRLAEAFGRESAERMSFFHSRDGNLAVKGYAGNPDLHRPNSKGILLFVNRRPVRDRLLFRAALVAYRNVIPKDRYPVILLFLEIPPEQVDVNVHPSKWEIKFTDSESVYRLVVSAVRGMIEKGPWKKGTERSFPEIKEGEASYGRGFPPGERPPQREEAIPLAWESSPLDDEAPGASFWGQIDHTYLLFGVPDGLILMDQHAAHERILFERLEEEFSSGRVSRQPLLIPEMPEWGRGECERLEEHSDKLLRLGFEVEPSGNRSFWVKAVPEVLATRQPLRALEEMVRSLSTLTKTPDWENPFQALLQVMACHGAIPAGQRLSAQEAMGLLLELQKCRSPSFCPHGRPTLKKITVSDLEKMFGRRT